MFIYRGDQADFGHGEKMDTSKSPTMLTLEQCCLWSICWYTYALSFKIVR